MDSIDTDSNYQITASAQEINKLHAEAEALAKTSKEYASNAIQLALEIGARLVKERAACEKGKWIEWQEKNLTFKRTRAYHYIALYERVCGLPDDVTHCVTQQTNDVSQCETQQIEQSEKLCSPVVNTNNSEYEQLCNTPTRKLLNDAKSLRQALTMVGIIPSAPKEKKDEKIKPTITFTKPIDAFVLWYNKRTENDPISDWQPETRALLITNLRPIVAIYQELIALQDKANYPVRDSQRVLTQ